MRATVGFRIDRKRMLHSPYHIAPPVSSSGFFGLSQLLAFCSGQLEPLVDVLDTQPLVLDFQQVRIWDVSVLLWMSIALQSYRQRGLHFRLKLPDIEDAADLSSNGKALRSGDFLRRWRFDTALSHVGDPSSVLVPDQEDYFVGGPRKYYTDSSVITTPNGFVSRLISNRLVNIRDLTRETTVDRQREVSDEEIQTCIKSFQDARIGNILSNNCEIKNWDDADSFADHLVAESLFNLKQHPNATTGLISVGVLGSSRELILTVADNGDSILNTILPVYNKEHGTSHTSESLGQLALETRQKILHFATRPYVSSKPLETDQEIGLGLTYIKRDVINKFKGKLRIISGSVQAIYQQDSETDPVSSSWKQRWHGNLLRISIPLKPGRY